MAGPELVRSWVRIMGSVLVRCWGMSRGFPKSCLHFEALLEVAGSRILVQMWTAWFGHDFVSGARMCLWGFIPAAAL